MPDIHLPKAHESHRPSIWMLLLEVALISLGVFLGLMGEQWRQSAEHRELAQQSLRRFASELRANQAAIRHDAAYHADKKTMIDAYFAAPPKARAAMEMSFSGIRPVAFEHGAWDLAVATQSLVYIEPDLASALSQLYTKQQEYRVLSDGIVLALYQPDNALALAGARHETNASDAFFAAVGLYYDDAVILDPELERRYTDLLAQIDRALGHPTTAAAHASPQTPRK